MNSLLKSTLTESKFNLWRGCVALIAIDGTIAEEEEKWINQKLSDIPFSKEQIAQLKSELHNRVDLDIIIPHITDKRDLAFLLHQIRTLGNIDGNYSPVEKTAFKDLENKILSNINIDSISNEVSSLEKTSSHNNTTYKVHNKHSYFENIYQTFRSFLNPNG